MQLLHKFTRNKHYILKPSLQPQKLTDNQVGDTFLAADRISIKNKE